MTNTVERRLFWSLIALAAALRIAAAIPLAFHHADELWQYTEPAYHLARGPWVQSWEMREGMRTWLIPMFLAPWMALGHWFGAHLLLPRLALAALSLVMVSAAWALGRAISQTHALFAGLAAAIWFELVAFAPRALSEPVSAALILGAAWLLLTGSRTDRRVAMAGFLLALAFAARFQCAPAIATLAIWEARTKWRAVWLPLLLGGLLGLAIDGAIDAIMGQPPFGWIWQNLRLNLIEHRAAGYGINPPLWYLANMARLWNVLLFPLLILAALGARRYPVLAAVAIVHLAAHMLIGHKEYRFVLLTHILVVILAGLGTVDLVRGRRVPAVLAALAWCATSAALAYAPANRARWTANHDLARAIQVAGEQPGACGLGLIRQPYVLSAAYALYDQPSPIYVFRGQEPLQTTAFNTAMLRPGDSLPGYRTAFCNSAACIATRSGSCAAGPRSAKINQVAAKIGE